MSENVTVTKPKKSESRKKSEIIYVRVDPREKLEFQKKAEAVGLTIPSFIRSEILDRVFTKNRTAPPLDRVCLSQLSGQLGIVGSNLNQIARTLKESDTVAEERIISACNEVSMLRDEIIETIRLL